MPSLALIPCLGCMSTHRCAAGDCFDAVIPRTPLLVPQQHVPKQKREPASRSPGASAAANVAAAAAAVIPSGSSSTSSSGRTGPRPAGGGML